MAMSRPQATHAAAVPVAFVLANALSYALLLVAAHLLSAGAYGRLSSLLGLLLIATIPMLALQTVAARRCATDAGPTGVVRGTVVMGGAAMLALAALSPALAAFLHFHGVGGILLVAASVPAGAVLGTAMGVAQGRRQFRRLAVLLFVSTGGRSASGLIGLLVGRTPDAAIAGVTVGMTVCALAVALSGPGVRAHHAALRDRTRAGVLVETLHASHAHGTFLLLTSLDVLLARHVLSSSDAGVYAAGAVVTRAAVWLPQSIIALMFASLAESERHHHTARRASGVVLALGALIVLGTAAAGPLVVSVFGRGKYQDLDHTIWLFALFGTLLAVLQLSVLAGLAQRTARRAALLWATVAADVAVVLAVGADATPTRVVVALASITALSATVALWLTVRGPALGPLLRRAAAEGLQP
jgi:O-antigen/teichoic acid export membrane protein